MNGLLREIIKPEV